MSSTFPTRAAFERKLAPRPSRLPYGATSGFTARSAHRFASMGSQPMANQLRFSWTPRGVTEGAWLPVCSTALRVGSFHPTGRSATSWRTIIRANCVLRSRSAPGCASRGSLLGSVLLEILLVLREVLLVALDVLLVGGD